MIELLHAAKEQENQQLIRELEQTKLRLNEREQALKELERSMDQMQLGAKGESQKSADVKLRWREGKPAPQKMMRVCNAVTDKEWTRCTSVLMVIMTLTAMTQASKFGLDCQIVQIVAAHLLLSTIY